MARHGENVRKRKDDGRWEARYLVYSEEKGKKIYRSVYAKSYEEAKKKRIIKESLLEKETLDDRAQGQARNARVSENIPFMEAAGEWLAKIRETKKPSTYVKYSLICRNYLNGPFQKVTLGRVTEAFVREKISDHLSESVQKSVYCVINQVLKSASVRYNITFPYIKRPATNVQNRPVEVLSQGEQSKLFSSLCNGTNIYKKAVLLCLHTGLRLGEVCALKWMDIDFENKILVVRRTAQRLYSGGHHTKTVLVETEPKSGFSRREIPLSDTVLELLASLWNDGAYVFGKERAMEPRTLQYQFKKILGEAGLPNHNFHILRHTFATNCVEGGVDVKCLSEMLGHADVRITLNRYVHPSMDTKRRHMDVLCRFYDRIHGQVRGQTS